MLKRKVIAGPIQNLTDARYFAAWMVDYMSFELGKDQIQISQLKEIIDWVEGPLILGDISQVDSVSDIFELQKELGLHGFISNDSTLLNQLKAYSDHLFLRSDTQLSDDVFMITSPEICADLPESSFLDSRHIDVQTLNNIHPSVGIHIGGGDEIKTGLKSFEDLDEIFEAIEED